MLCSSTSLVVLYVYILPNSFSIVIHLLAGVALSRRYHDHNHYARAGTAHPVESFTRATTLYTMKASL
jgi:hypothetical protein